MSLVRIEFYITSSMLNMFRTLIHPSSGACDFSIVSQHWSCVLVPMCVGSFGAAGLGWYPCSRLQASACYTTQSALYIHTTYAAALKTTTHPKTRCRKPYAATQHLMLLMMGVCTRNMSS